MVVGPGLMPVSWLPCLQHTHTTPFQSEYRFVPSPLQTRRFEEKSCVLKLKPGESTSYNYVPIRDGILDLNPSLHIAIISHLRWSLKINNKGFSFKTGTIFYVFSVPDKLLTHSIINMRDFEPISLGMKTTVRDLEPLEHHMLNVLNIHVLYFGVCV